MKSRRRRRRGKRSSHRTRKRRGGNMNSAKSMLLSFFKNNRSVQDTIQRNFKKSPSEVMTLIETVENKNLGKEMRRISKMLLVDKDKDIKKIMQGGNLAVPLTISCVACTMLGIIYVMREGAGFPILACAAICRAAMAV